MRRAAITRMADAGDASEGGGVEIMKITGVGLGGGDPNDQTRDIMLSFSFLVIFWVASTLFRFPMKGLPAHLDC